MNQLIRKLSPSLVAGALLSITAQAEEDTFSLRGLDRELGSYQTFVIKAPDGALPDKENPFRATIVSPYLHGLHFPTDVVLKNNTIKENFPEGTKVGDLRGIDPDLQERFNFALVEGEGSKNNKHFYIDGDVLRNKSIFYNEIKDQYSIRIAATDSTGLSIEKQFKVQVLLVPPVTENLYYNPDFFLANPATNVVSGTIKVDTDTQQMTGALNATGALMPDTDGNFVSVFSFEDLTLGKDVTMEFTGEYAVALVSKNDLNIDGKLILNGSDGISKTTPGGGLKGAPKAVGGGGGGFGGAIGLPGEGPGGGKVRGGGASHGGVGAFGNNNGNVSGKPGDIYGTTRYEVKMIGGSGGAGGQSNFRVGSGGAGGGALQLRAANSVLLGENSLISANGGKGGSASAGGGGGSGGTVIIKALSIAHNGTIEAKGGDGGTDPDGSGGAGGGGVVLFNAEEITNEGAVDLAGGQYGYIEEEDFPAAKEGVLLLINSFEPYIAWGQPKDLTYGEAVSSDQLNAASDIAGNFVYDPPLETILPVGAHVLKATFNPTDPDKYQTQTLYRTVMVHRAPLTITLHDKTRVWGTENPDLTYSITGWVLGEGADLLIGGVTPSTDAKNESRPQDYVITATHGTTKSYKISVVDGTLNVFPPPKPVITSLIPKKPKLGQLLTIFGENLRSVQEVKIGKMEFEASVESDEMISIKLPDTELNGFLFIRTYGGSVISKTKVRISNPRGTIFFSKHFGKADTRPAVGRDGHIYLAIGRGDHGDYRESGILKIDPKGDVVWFTKLNDDPTSELCLDDTGNSYVVTGFNSLQSLSPDGDLRWTYKNDDRNVTLTSDPSINLNNEILIAESTNKLLYVDANGKIKSSFDLGAQAQFPAVTSLDGTVYVCAKNMLYSLSKDGNLNWKKDIENHFLSGYLALTADGDIVAPFTSNGVEKVFKINGSNGDYAYVWGGTKSAVIAQNELAFFMKNEFLFGTDTKKDVGENVLWNARVGQNNAPDGLWMEAPVVSTSGTVYAMADGLTDAIQGPLIAVINNGDDQVELKLGSVRKSPVIDPRGKLYLITTKSHGYLPELTVVMGDYGELQNPWPMQGNNAQNNNRQRIDEAGSSKDSDDDGLLDEIETDFYGTNPELADTDSDGLNDGDEIYTHNTDPLNPDSDGDGYNDGDEIAKGTNPNDNTEYPVTGLQNGLVAYYPFNGNANDESGNGNHGTISGAVLENDKNGDAVSAYSFDGIDDYINAGNVLSSFNKASYSVWFYLNDNNNTQNIIQKRRSANGDGMGLQIYQQDLVAVYNTGKIKINLRSPLTAQKKWNHAVFSFGEGEAKLFVNGKLISKTERKGAEWLTSNQELWIGRGFLNAPDNGGTRAFSGSIDDVRIYNRALTEAEVSELYELEKPVSPLEQGLVAYYPFNGNANDESGNGNHGEVMGAELIKDRNGEVAKAYKFNGDDYILGGNVLNRYDVGTISLWVKPETFNYARIFDKKRNSNSEGNGLSLIINYPNGESFAFGLNREDNPYTSGLKKQDTDKFFHVVGVSDGSNIKLYVDGVVESSQAVYSEAAYSSERIQIGGAYERFVGIIDDVRIYNRALSEAEVSELYELEKPVSPLEQGLVAYYPFNGNANDESGNGHNGIINGAKLGKDRYGTHNNSFYFNGKSSINADDISLSNNYSFSVWIKSISEDARMILNFANPGSTKNHAFLMHNINSIHGVNNLRFNNRIPLGTSGGINAYSSNTLHDDLWHHVVGIKNDSSLILYVDGNKDKEISDTKKRPNVLTNLIIGENFDNWFYEGQIDDIRIYNRALSEAEVSELYGLEKPTIDLTDSDSDGLSDSDEINIHKTDPNLADSDGDGIYDGTEVKTKGMNPIVKDNNNENLLSLVPLDANEITKIRSTEDSKIVFIASTADAKKHYVIKCTIGGQKIWQKEIVTNDGGKGTIFFNDIDTHDNALYIAGQASANRAIFAGKVIHSQPSSFFTKLNLNDGSFGWQKAISGSSIVDITVTNEGRIFVCGSYGEYVSFWLDAFKIPVKFAGKVRSNALNSYIVEYSPDGTPLKGISFGDDRNIVTIDKITNTPAGNLFFTVLASVAPIVSGHHTEVLGQKLTWPTKYLFAQELNFDSGENWTKLYHELPNQHSIGRTWAINADDASQYYVSNELNNNKINLHTFDNDGENELFLKYPKNESDFASSREILNSQNKIIIVGSGSGKSIGDNQEILLTLIDKDTKEYVHAIGGGQEYDVAYSGTIIDDLVIYGGAYIKDLSLPTGEKLFSEKQKAYISTITLNQFGNQPEIIDTDNDGISDSDEINIHKTNPNLADTDGDGINDGTEINNGTNPLSPLDEVWMADMGLRITQNHPSFDNYTLTDDHLIQFNTPNIQCISLLSGEVKWEKPIFKSSDYINWNINDKDSLFIADNQGKVFALTYDGVLKANSGTPDIYCFDEHNGNLLWSVDIGDQQGQYYLDGSELFVSSRNNILKIDTNSGDIKLRYSYPKEPNFFVLGEESLALLMNSNSGMKTISSYDRSNGQLISVVNNISDRDVMRNENKTYSNGKYYFINKNAVFCLFDPLTAGTANRIDLKPLLKNFSVADGLRTTMRALSDDIFYGVLRYYSKTDNKSYTKLFEINNKTKNVRELITKEFDNTLYYFGILKDGTIAFVENGDLVFHNKDGEFLYELDEELEIREWKELYSGDLIVLLKQEPTGGKFKRFNKQDLGEILDPIWPFFTQNPSNTNFPLSKKSPLVDSDSDGLSDSDEINVHKTNPNLADTDKDGLSDGIEILVLNLDALKIDSDADGVNDGDEDFDFDGLTNLEEIVTYKTNPALADTDKDGLSDGIEVAVLNLNPLKADSDNDGINDGDEDFDSDGLTNLEEIETYKTNPALADTDGDQLSDGKEVKLYKTDPKDIDTDNDGLSDGIEVLVLLLDPLKVDSDNDGINDGDEDFDLDGLTNLEEIVTYKTDPTLADTDKDGLSDGIEVAVLNLNPLKADSDNDGINDGDEDFDSDGLTNLEEIETYKTNPALADTDKDGLSDGIEVKVHKTNPNDADSDDDGLSDGLEILVLKTPPLKSDNDGDGIKDGDEDADSDGLTNFEEVSQYKTNPVLADTDQDGLTDGQEVNILKTDPLVKDTDNDGLSDFAEDFDKDGLSNGDELTKYKTNPLLADSDNDGLSDWDEINKYKTNPNLADTDGDGLKDGEEVNNYKTNPLLADTDGDGLSDGNEIKRSKTNPLVVDTDEDETNDGDEIEAGTDPNDPKDFPINIVAPVITVPPDSVFAKAGENVMFKVEARGVPIAYQWFKSGKPIDGANANLLRLFIIDNEDTGAYTVEVSNQAGKVMSSPAFLKIVKAPPVFEEIPARFDLVYEKGETLILDPKIKTEGPTTFQWDKDGIDLPGETDPILIIENVKDEDAGNYTVDATNLAGTTISETMRVSVVDEAKIGQHIENNFIKIQGYIDSSPAVGLDGSVYYSTTGEFGYLYRHEPNGVRKWGLSFDSGLRGSPAIDHNEIIYVLEDSGALHAVKNQGSKAKKLWSFKLTGEDADAAGEYREFGNSPAITEDGTVIFGWFDRFVYAVKDGDLVWKFPTEGRILASPSIAPDGTIYIGDEDGYLYAINPDGKAAWSKPFSTGKKIITRPAIDTDGNIYFGSFSGKFYAIDSKRVPIWTFDTEQDIWSSAVIRADGTVYFGADDGYFYALDTKTGEVKWTYRINNNWQKASTAALGLDGSIYFTLEDDNFYSINRIGKKLWSVKLKGDGDDVATFSSPSLLDDGKIYIGTKDGDDGVINVIQGGSPIDIDSPWPRFGGDMQNTGRVMVKTINENSFKAKLRVIDVANNKISIQITGDAFETYKLQYSNDLKTWKVVPDLQTVQTNFRGKANFERSIQSNSKPTFYRVLNE